jgi:Lrp/AsnC family transcriptional regulator, regulator for asnA, asnC and gidA
LSTQKLDNIDKAILKTLIKDARTSFTSIAKSLNVSTNVIAKRFQRLKDLKIIAGTATIVNLPELEPKHRLAIDLKIQNSVIDEVIEKYSKHPIFRASFRTIGPYDFHMAIGVRSLVEAEKIGSDLRKRKGVSQVILSASLDSKIFLPENLII